MTTSTLTPDQIERLAVRRVKAKMGWYLHAAIYVAVNIGLACLSLWQGRHWHLFPLLGWGLGLTIHGLAVWLEVSSTGGTWRQAMLDKERAALSRHQG